MRKAILILALVTAAARAADTLSEDEAAIAKHIQALHDPSNEVRAVAAQVLREIVARYGNGTSNIREKDAGESRWMEKVRQVTPSMTEAEVLKILPHYPGSQDDAAHGSGDSHVVSYRLDPHWMITVYYRNPDKLIEQPKLARQELSIYIPPPSGYTGVWTTWYVNGQKSREIQFKDGKYNGTFTNYHDNGNKAYEQHYANHAIDGPDNGWYPDGKKMYAGQYRNGKQHGLWVHWHPNGQKQAERNYKDGKLDGPSAWWHPNGQISHEDHYKDGLPDGIQSAWSDEGRLYYKREYKDGKTVQ